MSEIVLGGLVKRRAELAGDIERMHETLRKLVLDLKALDATIVQFDPDFQVETIKPKAFRPPKDWSNRGQMSPIVLTSSAKPQSRLPVAISRWSFLWSGPWTSTISGYCGSCQGGWAWRSGLKRKMALCGVNRGRGSTCCGR